MIGMLIMYYCSIFDKYWDDSHIVDVSWYGGMMIMMNMWFVMIMMLYAHDEYDMHKDYNVMIWGYIDMWLVLCNFMIYILFQCADFITYDGIS